MKLILCLDDKNGMAFNRRRQTRDKEMRKHLYGQLNGARLLVSPYSAKLLSDEYENLMVSEDYLMSAQSDDFVWSEIDDVKDCLDKADTLYVYRWNRVYPSDLRFTFPDGFKTVRREELAGSSHDLIIFKEYQR